MVRNAVGEAVALRSKDAEYSIVRNVPCLIPELGNSTRGNLPLWQAHQKKMWREYQDGDEGVFTSEGNAIGRRVGEIIARSGGGLYLDVGCGALAQPVYMAAPRGCVEWIGVDSFLGNTVRQFPFVQGLGEYLPFLPEVFEGALYAGTIYHQLDPRHSLRRVHSVLKPMGKLFAWYTASRLGLKYLIWRGLRAFGFARLYGEDYQWAFTTKSLRTQLESAGFAVEDNLFWCEACPDYSECDHASNYLTITHRM